MRMNSAKALVGAIALTSLISAACGSEGGLAPGDQVAAGGNTTSSLAEPSPGTREVTPSTHPPEVIETNPNRRDNHVGSLCWARWEVVRTLVKGFRGGDDSGVAVDQFSQRIGEIRGQVDAIQDRVPQQYSDFAARFRRDIDSAGGLLDQSRGEPAVERFQGIAGSFDFNNYPGIREYLATAPEDPDCEMP